MVKSCWPRLQIRDAVQNLVYLSNIIHVGYTKPATKPDALTTQVPYAKPLERMEGCSHHVMLSKQEPYRGRCWAVGCTRTYHTMGDPYALRPIEVIDEYNPQSYMVQANVRSIESISPYLMSRVTATASDRVRFCNWSSPGRRGYCCGPLLKTGLSANSLNSNAKSANVSKKTHQTHQTH